MEDQDLHILHNFMAANDLATQGTKVSATLMLT